MTITSQLLTRLNALNRRGLIGARSASLAWVYDDGGRSRAGFKGQTGDCVCRSIAIAAELPYAEVYELIKVHAERERPSKRKRQRSSPRLGVHRPTIRRMMDALGWSWHPTMGIGTGCRVHLASGELPGGRLVVSVSKHLTAVIDGVVHDTHDPGRNGTRCVYGYWSRN